MLLENANKTLEIKKVSGEGISEKEWKLISRTLIEGKETANSGERFQANGLRISAHMAIDKDHNPTRGQAVLTTRMKGTWQNPIPRRYITLYK